MCVQRLAQTQELSLEVAAVVVDRLGHKNTFDPVAVVLDLDLAVGGNFVVTEAVLDARWMALVFESSWRILRFLVVS
jgi:hypothetical protein